MGKELYAFDFGLEFQNRMLALMLADSGFALKTIEHIPEEQLYSDAHRYLFGRIKEKIKTHPESPSYLEIEDHFTVKIERSRRRLYKSFILKIFEIKLAVADIEFVKDKMTEYAKRCAFITVFQGAQTLWNLSKPDEAYQVTMDGMGDLYSINFREDASIPIEKFEEQRQLYLFKSETRNKIPTIIRPLDDMLRGGLEKGELGILLAHAKGGKSIGLVHMGCAALFTRFGRVAHFVLEGTTEQTIIRYQSRITSIEFTRLEKDELTDEERLEIDAVGKRHTSRLDLIPFNQHWKYTVQDISDKIIELQRHGRKPDLVIIDYADLLTGTGNKEHRHEQTEVYRSLKTLAMVHKVAIWTGAQAQRPPNEPELKELLRARNISECYEKVRIADLVITLNQTPYEKYAGVLRFHIDIYRSNDADITLTLIVNFKKMTFFSPLLGYLEKADIPEWMRAKKKKK